MPFSQIQKVIAKQKQNNKEQKATEALRLKLVELKQLKLKRELND